MQTLDADVQINQLKCSSCIQLGSWSGVMTVIR